LSVVRLFVGKGKCVVAGWMLFLSLITVAAAESQTGTAASGDSGSPAATRTTLTVTTDNSGPRTEAILKAHVETDAGTAAGIVTFRSGAIDLGSAVVDADGDASLRTAALSPGQHEVVADYQGQSQFLSSTSHAQVVQAHASSVAGYTVTATPTSLTTVQGGFVNSTITIVPNNGFSGYVALSCSNLPAYSSCTFNPTNTNAGCVTTAGKETCTPGVSTMQIQTLAPSPNNGALRQEGGTLRYAFAFPMLAGLAGFGAWKRRPRNLLLALIAFAGVMGMGGCSQRYNYLHHGPPGNTGTPTGTFTVNIQASSSTGATTVTPPTLPQITLVINKS
jgi:hypothetical protein